MMVKLFSDMGGTVRGLRRFPDPKEKLWSAFNPSVSCSDSGQYAMTIRSSNYVINDLNGAIDLTLGNVIKTRNWFCELSEDLTIENLREIQFDHGELDVYRGVEDIRLFWRPDGWYFTAVMLERGHTRYSRLCIYKYDSESNIATFIQKLETPTPTLPEKNWMAPDIATNKFDYIYSTTQVYKDGALLDVPNPPNIEVRGGSGLVLQPDGTYLAVVHRVDVTTPTFYNPRIFGVQKRTVRNYTHLFARYNEWGTLIELSEEFLFESEGIEYAAGLVEHGSDLLISYGKRDVAVYLGTISKQKVLDTLVPFVDNL
jgi:hypothetical protein